MGLTCRGRKYAGNQFQNWALQKKIIDEVTTAYFPESIDNAYSLNWKLLNMVRMMLQKFSATHQELWTEAVNTAYYIRNRLFTKSFSETKTAFEIIYGTKPNLRNFRIFGCRAFVHMPPQKLDEKFNVRSMEGVLVRYFKGSAYRILLSDNKTVVQSKDVRFDESIVPMDKKEKVAVLKFDMSDKNGIFEDTSRFLLLSMLLVQHETEVHTPSYQSMGAEGQTLPADSETDNNLLEILTYYPYICQSTRATAGEPPQRFGCECILIKKKNLDNRSEISSTFGEAMTR